MGFTPAELGRYAARSEGQSHKQISKCQCTGNGAMAGAALASPRSEPRLSNHSADEAAEQAFRKHLREDMGASRAYRCFKIIDIVEGR